MYYEVECPGCEVCNSGRAGEAACVAPFDPEDSGLESLSEESEQPNNTRESDVKWEVGRWRAAAAQNAELPPTALLFVPKELERLSAARGEELARLLGEANALA